MITATGTELVVDGVRIVFQLTPGTEAPAEMNFHFPDHAALCMAENCTATFHNLYTPRGAQVRDALAWSKYINESIELFADQTDIAFASHHWPRWGATTCGTYLRKQRDLYRYLHDQTMRLANHGQTMVEIAEELDLPAALGDEFFNRGYYGTVNHNVKAVYQRYLAGSTATRPTCTRCRPSRRRVRYVEYMGGADAVLERARAVVRRRRVPLGGAGGEPRRASPNPTTTAARALQADALEQLGYQAESGPWRNFYLTGAQELRHGPPPIQVRSSAQHDVISAMTVEMLLQYVGVRLNGPRAVGIELAFTIEVTDAGPDGGPELHAVGLRHGALHHTRGRHHHDADVTVRTPKEALVAAVSSGRLESLADHPEARIVGRVEALTELSDLLDSFELFFPIVTP